MRRSRTIGDGFSPTVPVIDDGGRLIRESFDIALHLEDAYPDRPSLFGGEGGKAMARFVDSLVGGDDRARRRLPMVIKDVHDRLSPDDQVYFRASREKRFGRRWRCCRRIGTSGVGRLARRWEPLRAMLARTAVHRRRKAALRGLQPLRRAAMDAGDEPVPAASRTATR